MMKQSVKFGLQRATLTAKNCIIIYLDNGEFRLTEYGCDAVTPDASLIERCHFSPIGSLPPELALALKAHFEVGTKPYSPYMTADEWKRLREMKDEDIDTSDIPEWTEEDFKKARIVFPGEN